MTWKHYLGITLISVILLAFSAYFQTAPGYMDAEYYYSLGLRIASGQGLSEPFLWNYLSAVETIPHPGFSYWMPMPAFLSAVGIWITGLKTFVGAKAVHVLLAVFIPALTMKVTQEITENSSAAILAGLLAVFPVFYRKFIITTDSFAIIILLGGLFYLLSRRNDRLVNFIGIGLIAGMIHLSRADGLVWLIAGMFCAVRAPKNKHLALISVVGGYLISMAPWFVRNLDVFGKILPSGLTGAFWFREYNDLFTYSTSRLTYQNWASRGAQAILRNYLDAGIANLKTALFVQGQILLAPFVVLGSWKHRRDTGLQAAFLVWLGIFLIMSVVFPFAGLRGGFLHSSAAFQVLVWSMAGSGFFIMIDWGVDKRDWTKSKAGTIFGGVLVVMIALASFYLFSNNVIGSDITNPIWNKSNHDAKEIALYLEELNPAENDLVMINNPPGFYAASGKSSIVIPSGGLENLLLAGNAFGARYLILEENHTQELNDLYENPEIDKRLLFLGQVNGALIFQLPEYE
jgi:hypothetical protein